METNIKYYNDIALRIKSSHYPDGNISTVPDSIYKIYTEAVNNYGYITFVLDWIYLQFKIGNGVIYARTKYGTNNWQEFKEIMRN